MLSSAWRQRWEGSNEPTVGAGVAVEADTLKGLFITNQEKFQRRTILIMLPGTTPADIPLDLHRLNRFRIEKIDRNSIEPLIRALSNQPRYAVPELGFIPVLPPVSETDKGDPIDLPAIRHELQTAELALTTSPNDDAGEASRAQLRRRISRARGTLRGLGEAVPSPLAGPDTTSVDDETEKQDRSHSSEQSAILNHSPSSHGVVLTGPGTGKSTTLLELVARLRSVDPEFKARIVTFTRAATAELLDKIRSDGHSIDEPLTVHSFALSVLMRNPDQSPLPLPLRIPDDWEAKNLIQRDLAYRLKQSGFNNVTPKIAEELIGEMAAG